MPQISAGLLLYRIRNGELELFLAHPGGPFWKRRDEGVWTIPKGRCEADEALLETACREFEEETAIQPQGPFVSLGFIQQRSGKVVHGWAWQGDADPALIRSNFVQLEYPPRSGKFVEMPEIDRCGWFPVVEARSKLLPAQVDFVDRLVKHLAEGG